MICLPSFERPVAPFLDLVELATGTCGIITRTVFVVEQAFGELTSAFRFQWPLSFRPTRNVARRLLSAQSCFHFLVHRGSTHCNPTVNATSTRALGYADSASRLNLSVPAPQRRACLQS